MRFTYLILCLFSASVIFSADLSETLPLPKGFNLGIMEPSCISTQSKAAFLASRNSNLTFSQCLNWALLYEEECLNEGVNSDVAFAQMLLETSSLRFGGQVKGGQNNFGGLGALDSTSAGLSFLTPRMGVRAQVQHLKYYAGFDELNLDPSNPRLPLIKRGSAPTIFELSGHWASDPDYGKKLFSLLEKMAAFSLENSGTSQELVKHF